MKLSARNQIPAVVTEINQGEATANVTLDAAALCVKAGNAVILRGGKEARHSNAILHRILQDALAANDLPVDAVHLVATPDRAAVGHLLRLNQLIDLDLALIEDAYQAEYVARLQRSERLATIGQVAGGVAHELRNPLNVVKTSVYYLLSARNPTPEKRAEHLQRGEAGACRSVGR